MQKLWTIEAKADFADPAKNDVITDIMRKAAVHANAMMALLGDGQRAEVVFYSDDFFNGVQELKLHDDELGKAITDHEGSVGDGQVSDELMQAAREAG